MCELRVNNHKTVLGPKLFSVFSEIFEASSDNVSDQFLDQASA